LANDFFNGFNVIEFTVFLLGWIAGGGSKTWTYSDKKHGTASLLYQSVILATRCPDIMDFLACHMNQRGFHDIFVARSPNGMNRLRIPVNINSNTLLLSGITHMKASDVPVHSKLKFLNQLLTSPNLKIPETFDPPWRYNFHQHSGSWTLETPAWIENCVSIFQNLRCKIYIYGRNRTKFSHMNNNHMYKLNDGTYLEERMFRFGLTCKYEQ
jgi:hypothetical protein